MTRLTSDGFPDASFTETSSDGYVIARRANDLKVQKDGKFIVSGGSTADEFLASRINTNGTVDNSFGTNGIQAVSMGASTDYATSLDLQGNYIILGGMANNSLALTRLANSAAVVLPLQLTDVTVRAVDGNGLVNWQTASEENTSRFEIERSSDNRNYVNVGSKSAAGHSSLPLTYSYTDKNITALGVPVVYYRLKMLDNDGRFTCSKTVVVNISSPSAKVIIYPNPVRDVATLQITSLQGETLCYRITDANGRTMLTKSVTVSAGNNTISIDTHALSSGNYALLLRGTETTKEIKFVKQ